MEEQWRRYPPHAQSMGGKGAGERRKGEGHTRGPAADDQEGEQPLLLCL